MRIYVAFDGLIVLYISLGIIGVGLILYFINCFIKVGKDRCAIIERMGIYLGTYGKGWHFFNPLTTRRVGYYKLGTSEVIFYINREKYSVKFDILNFKDYHYIGAHDAAGICKASLQDSKDNLSETLIKRFEKVGCRFVSLDKILNK